MIEAHGVPEAARSRPRMRFHRPVRSAVGKEAMSVSRRFVSGMVPSMMRSPGNTTTASPRKSATPFRQTPQSAMPKLLTNGHKTPRDKRREMRNQEKPKALRERLLKIWAKL